MLSNVNICKDVAELILKDWSIGRAQLSVDMRVATRLGRVTFQISGVAYYLMIIFFFKKNTNHVILVTSNRSQ